MLYLEWLSNLNLNKCSISNQKSKMNLGQLERYAPKARIDFIQAVTAKASKLGVSKNEILEAKKSGDALIIGGNVFPANIDFKRKALVERVEKEGFDKVMEEAAYTWFNRFTAMRYMEIHGYIEEHPFSLFEGSDGSSEPEIIKHVADVGDWEDLNFNLALDLKTQNKTEELYQLIITSQCHSLGKNIPFLFALDAVEIELLLPEGLLLSDSIIKEMISVLNKENLSEVESLGWLYQFYISEKKDGLIKAKKAYIPDDIPAVTQLFTPNWIVKYLVQNSIGRLWLSTYPSSFLRQKMEYYIEPAEQTEKVKNQLGEITCKSLNPEEITVLDPACGSGHMLIEAYNLLKEIYLERGYEEKKIPQLILEKNLFGLDIDERAVQLARFSILMQTRKDDKRIFHVKRGTVLNIYAIQETNDLQFEEYKIENVDELGLVFHNSKTIGSLVEISENSISKLKVCFDRINDLASSPINSIETLKARELLPFLKQFQLISRTYDVVITNPPYMGSKGMNTILKDFAKNNFPDSKSDIFAICIDRYMKYGNKGAIIGLVTPFVWMFLSSFEKLRSNILNRSVITSLIQLEYNAFAPACIPVCCFALQKIKLPDYEGSFIKLTDFKGSHNQAPKTLEAINNPDCGWLYSSKMKEFEKIPGKTLAYWLSKPIKDIFYQGVALKELVDVKHGMSTGNNNKFTRLWSEVDHDNIGFAFTNNEDASNSDKKWFPYNKGGAFRKWYGNASFIVNYKNGGMELISDPDNSGFRHDGRDCYFRSGITWSFISSSYFGVRYAENGFVFDVAGSSLFTKKVSIKVILAYLGSKVAHLLLNSLNPTLNFQVGNLKSVPVPISILEPIEKNLEESANKLVEIAKYDWNLYEKSWNYPQSPLTMNMSNTGLIEESYFNWIKENEEKINEYRFHEEAINKCLITALGIEKDLSEKIPDEQITLTINPKYRYWGANLPSKEIWQRFKQDSVRELVSYSVGCILGRFSLDYPELVYAHSGNKDFDTSKYKTLPIDDDGIITLSDTEDLVIQDDLSDRFVEFVKTVWGEDTLSENLNFVADTLGSKNNELPKETIRRWVTAEFFKDHLQRYKNRPIYWLFSSGKKKAFEALVYLHRYNEGTLSRMRMKYVVPLQSRISDRLKTIEDDIASASSAQERNRLTRLKKVLADKELELREYDETLRHLAEQQIKLDLDDGVKVNYSKFPGLLAETKKVCGA